MNFKKGFSCKSLWERIKRAGVEQLPTAELTPYARNARTHSPEQINQIAASIQEFGFTNPILIDATNEIIAGHGRVMAAQKLGIETLPCIRLSHLSETQKRAYIIADNKIALNSGWDEALLAQELEDLDALGFDMEQFAIFTELDDETSGEIIQSANNDDEIEIPAEYFATEEEKQAPEITHEFAKITRYQRPKCLWFRCFRRPGYWLRFKQKAREVGWHCT